MLRTLRISGHTGHSNAMGLPSRMADRLLFNNVQPSDWFYNAVTWAYENGIVDGVSVTEFAPGRHIVRSKQKLQFYEEGWRPGAIQLRWFIKYRCL